LVKTWQQKNPAKLALARLKWRLKSYGFTLEDYNAMFEKQNGRCAICGRDVPLHIDHDHVTGEFRGLLCFNCNTGIGSLKEDPQLLNRAAQYLTPA
jgi:hypothetical protein